MKKICHNFDLSGVIDYMAREIKNINNYEQFDDAQLVDYLRENPPVNNHAFNVLYNRYADKLKAYCSFKAENKHDAEEIFQETWLKFYNIAHTSAKSLSLPAYLYKIARNLSVDKYRSKDRNIFNLENFELENFAEPMNINSNFESKELLSLLSLAVNSLQNIYKEAFVLKWFSGLNFNEIAEITGETSECVRKRCSRAMQDLIKILKPIITEINGQELR